MKINKLIEIVAILLLNSCGHEYPYLKKQDTKEIIVFDESFCRYKRLTDESEIKKNKDLIANDLKKSQKVNTEVSITDLTGLTIHFISKSNDTVSVFFNYEKAALYCKEETYWVYANVSYITGRYLVDILFDDLSWTEKS